MWQRLSMYDVRVIGHYLGIMILLSTFMYLPPFLTAILLSEWEPASRYLLSMGISLVIGMALRFCRIEPGRLNRLQALVVTGLSWIVLALLASIPLYFSGHYATVLDAVFDGVSGLTTTGASVIYDLDHLAYSDNMFRFMMHLVGGLGLVVIALSLGLFGRGGSASLYNSEGRSEHVIPNIVKTTQFIARIALVFIALATVLLSMMCLFSGMEPVRAVLHALWLAISAFTTSGFAPMTENVLYYHNFAIEFTLMVLMILGAINFGLFLQIWKGDVIDFFRDIEIRTMVLWLCVIVCIFTASLMASTVFSNLPAMMRRGLFMVVAAFSTTGLQNVTNNELTTVFTSGAFLVLGFVMAIGGGAGSTAGGIKFSRVGLIVKSIVATVKERLAPDSARVVVTYNRGGRRTLSPDVAKEAMTVTLLFVITYAAGALVGVAYGYDAMEALFQSIAMASNGGLSTITSAGMPAPLEAFYIFEMWAGRLEFISFLAVIAEIFISLVPRRGTRGNARRKGGK